MQVLTFTGQITSRIEQLHTRRERDILRAQKLQQLAEFNQGQNIVLRLDHEVEKEAPRIEQLGNYWELVALPVWKCVMC